METENFSEDDRRRQLINLMTIMQMVEANMETDDLFVNNQEEALKLINDYHEKISPNGGEEFFALVLNAAKIFMIGLYGDGNNVTIVTKPLLLLILKMTMDSVPINKVDEAMASISFSMKKYAMNNKLTKLQISNFVDMVAHDGLENIVY